MNAPATADLTALANRIKVWGAELGFQQVGIATAELPEDEQRLNEWLALSWHGDMDYMQRHGTRRTRPVSRSQSAESVPIPGDATSRPSGDQMIHMGR